MDESINELDIINHIIDLNKNFVNFLSYTKNEIEVINNKINKIDNHFFTNNQDLIKNLHTIYNCDQINVFINDINENTKQLCDKINICCKKHDFVDDYIDTYFDHIKITYCRNCSLSKK